MLRHLFLEGLSGALVVAQSFAVLLDGAMHIYGERLDCSINRPSQKGYGGDGVSSPQPGRGGEGHLPHRSERWVWGGSPQGSGIGARSESLFIFRCKIVFGRPPGRFENQTIPFPDMKFSENPLAYGLMRG